MNVEILVVIPCNSQGCLSMFVGLAIPLQLIYTPDIAFKTQYV
jgi:hypothetical protein